MVTNRTAAVVVAATLVVATIAIGTTVPAATAQSDAAQLNELPIPADDYRTTGSTAQANGTTIDSCTVITEPGRYVLSEDVQNATDGTCIEIRTDDVVLDGGGHAVVGDRTAEEFEAFAAEMVENGSLPWEDRWANHAIAVTGSASQPLTNVTVTNVATTNWFFGVYFQQVSDATVRNVTATDNGDGISVYNATGVTAEDNTVAGNAGGGLLLGLVENATVTGTNATDNLDGINLYQVADSRIANNALDENEDGLFAVSLRETTIENNTASGNAWVGLFLSRSSGIEFSGNTVTNTTGETTFVGDSAGIFLYNATGNTFEGTTLRNNANWSFYSSFGAVDNSGENVDLGPVRVSFTATNASFALAADRLGNTAAPGDAVVTTNTENDSSISLDAMWAVNATVPPTNATANVSTTRTPNATAAPGAGTANDTAPPTAGQSNQTEPGAGVPNETAAANGTNATTSAVGAAANDTNVTLDPTNVTANDTDVANGTNVTVSTDAELQDAALQGARLGITMLNASNLTAPAANREAAVAGVVDAAAYFETRDDLNVTPTQMWEAAFGATYGALRPIAANESEPIAAASPASVTPNATYVVTSGAVLGVGLAANASASAGVQSPYLAGAASGAAVGTTNALINDSTVEAYAGATAVGASIGALLGANEVAQVSGTAVDPAFVRTSAQGAAAGTLDGVGARLQANEPPSINETVTVPAASAEDAVVMSYRNAWTPQQAYQHAFILSADAMVNATFAEPTGTTAGNATAG